MAANSVAMTVARLLAAEFQPTLSPKSLYGALCLLSILSPELRHFLLQQVHAYISLRQHYHLSLIFPSSHATFTKSKSRRETMNSIPPQILHFPTLSAQFTNISSVLANAPHIKYPLAMFYPRVAQFICKTTDTIQANTSALRSSPRFIQIALWVQLQRWVWSTQFRQAGLTPDTLKVSNLKALYKTLLDIPQSDLLSLTELIPQNDYAKFSTLFTIPTFSTLFPPSFFNPHPHTYKSQSQSPSLQTPSVTAPSQPQPSTTQTTTHSGKLAPQLPSTEPISTPLLTTHSIQHLQPSNKPPIPPLPQFMQSLLERASLPPHSNDFVLRNNPSASDFVETQKYAELRLKKHAARTIHQFQTGLIITCVKICKIIATWYDMIYIHELLTILPLHGNPIKQDRSKTAKTRKVVKMRKAVKKRNTRASKATDLDSDSDFDNDDIQRDDDDGDSDDEEVSDDEDESSDADLEQFTYSNVNFTRMEQLHQAGLQIVLKSIPSDIFHPGYQLPNKRITVLQNHYQHLKNAGELQTQMQEQHTQPSTLQSLPPVTADSHKPLHTLFSTQALPYIDQTIKLGQIVQNNCTCHTLDDYRSESTLFDTSPTQEPEQLYFYTPTTSHAQNNSGSPTNRRNVSTQDTNQSAFPICTTAEFDEIEMYALTGMTSVDSTSSSSSSSKTAFTTSTASHSSIHPPKQPSLTPQYPIFPVYPITPVHQHGAPSNQATSSSESDLLSSSSNVSYERAHIQWLAKQLLYTKQDSLWGIFYKTKQHLTGIINTKEGQNVERFSKRGERSVSTVVVDVKKKVSHFPSRSVLFSTPTIDSPDNFHLQKLFHYNYFSPHLNLYQNNPYFDHVVQFYSKHINSTTHNAPPQQFFSLTHKYTPSLLPNHYQYILTQHAIQSAITTFFNHHINSLQTIYKSIFNLYYLSQLPHDLEKEYVNQKLGLKDHTQLEKTSRSGVEQFADVTSTKTSFKRERVFYDENGNEVVRTLLCPQSLPPNDERYLEDLTGPHVHFIEIHQNEQKFHAQMDTFYQGVMTSIANESERYCFDEQTILSNLATVLTNSYNSFSRSIRDIRSNQIQMSMEQQRKGKDLSAQKTLELKQHENERVANAFSTEVLVFSKLLDHIMGHLRPLFQVNLYLKRLMLNQSHLNSDSRGFVHPVHLPIKTTSKSITFFVLSNNGALSPPSTLSQSSLSQSIQHAHLNLDQSLPHPPASDDKTKAQNRPKTRNSTTTSQPAPTATKPAGKSTKKAKTTASVSEDDNEPVQLHSAPIASPPLKSMKTKKPPPLKENTGLPDNSSAPKSTPQDKTKAKKQTTPSVDSSTTMSDGNDHLTMTDLFPAGDDYNDHNAQLDTDFRLEDADVHTEFDYRGNLDGNDSYNEDNDDDDDDDDEDLSLSSIGTRDVHNDAVKRELLQAAKQQSQSQKAIIPLEQKYILPPTKPPNYDHNSTTQSTTSRQSNSMNDDDDAADLDFYAVEVTPSSVTPKASKKNAESQKNPRRKINIFENEDEVLTASHVTTRASTRTTRSKK